MGVQERSSVIACSIIVSMAQEAQFFSMINLIKSRAYISTLPQHHLNRFIPILLNAISDIILHGFQGRFIKDNINIALLLYPVPEKVKHKKDSYYYHYSHNDKNSNLPSFIHHKL